MPDPGDSSGDWPSRSTTPGWLAIEVVRDSGDWERLGEPESLVTQAAAALSRHAVFSGHRPAEACIALSDDAGVRRLNAQFRGQDKPTNVLSFPAAADPPAVPGEAKSLGDVVLALETVEREAAEQGIAAADHLRHLVVHGLLHLLGFDHQTATEASDMEAREVEILAPLGIADPYASTECDEHAPKKRLA